MSRTQDAELAGLGASLEQIAALLACETPARGKQEEIMSKIGTVRARDLPRGWHVYVRATFDLAPEPPAVDGRPAPKRYCAASHRAIAAHLGKSVSATSEALGRLEREGVITVIRPGDPTWPLHAGRQGCFIAPTWGVLDQRVREADPQLELPMHGASARLPSAAPRSRLDGTERSETPSAFAERSAAPPSARAESVPVTGTLCAKALRLPVRIGGEGGEKEKDVLTYEIPSSPFETERSVSERSAWAELNGRLIRYGLLFAPRALAAARERGWTAPQIARLVDDCESQTIAGFRAWSPGLVFRHLQCCPPGARIEVPPSEEFRRARREISAAQATSQSQHEAHAADQQRSRQDADRAELEARYGEVLDGMPRTARDALAEDVLAGFPFAMTHYRRSRERLNTMLRLALLRGLRDREEGHAARLPD